MSRSNFVLRNSIDLIGQVRDKFPNIYIKYKQSDMSKHKIIFNIYFPNTKPYNIKYKTDDINVLKSPHNPYYLNIRMFLLLGNIYTFSRLTNSHTVISCKCIQSNVQLFDEITNIYNYLSNGTNLII
jgi:hypothetical protein